MFVPFPVFCLWSVSFFIFVVSNSSKIGWWWFITRIRLFDIKCSIRSVKSYTYVKDYMKPFENILKHHRHNLLLCLYCMYCSFNILCSIGFVVHARKITFSPHGHWVCVFNFWLGSCNKMRMITVYNTNSNVLYELKMRLGGASPCLYQDSIPVFSQSLSFCQCHGSRKKRSSM